MTFSANVNLGKTVDYKTLESALIKAAEEVGLKAKVKDKYSRDYQLGSVQEIRQYLRTSIFLRGKLLPAIEIVIYSKEPTNHFSLFSGFGFGVASKRKIKQFLEALSENV